MHWADEEVLEVAFRHLTLGQIAAQIGLVFATSRSSILGLVKRLRDAGVQAEAAGLTDDELLALTDAVLSRTTFADRLAKDFAGRGKHLSRYAVLWLVHGVMHDLAIAGPDDAVRASNQMRRGWPSWWRVVPVAGGAGRGWCRSRVVPVAGGEAQ